MILNDSIGSKKCSSVGPLPVPLVRCSVIPREILNFHHSYTTIHDTTGGKSGLKTGTHSHSAHCHFGSQGANIDSKMNSSLKLLAYFLLVILQIVDHSGRSVLPGRCYKQSPTPAPRCRFGAELDECGVVTKCHRGPGDRCGDR